MAKRPEETSILELIPHTKLAHDFPTLLIEEYAHWLNLTSGVVDFRPLDRQWDACSAEWNLHLSWSCPTTILPATMVAKARDNDKHLIDIGSPTFDAIARVLAPLEASQFLTVTRTASVLNVALPRYRLEFFVNESQQVECKNIRHMIIDEDASLGTLVGLRNRLILRAKSEHARTLPRSRTLLLPCGTVKTALHGDHVQTSIDIASQRHIRFFDYKIDTDIGYLAGAASLESRLYKIYLHAVTSHCLPDPLTQRTGTEEALHELLLGAIYSFQELRRQEVDLLVQIGDLSPNRVWYPPHLQRMETVHWSPTLPSLAQHNEFYLRTQSVLKFAHDMQFLIPNVSLALDKHLGGREDHLWARATQSSSIYYPLNDNMPPKRIDDRSFVARATPDTTGQDAGAAALWASKLISDRWSHETYTTFPLLDTVESWVRVCGLSSMQTVEYSSAWIHPSLWKTWISLYDCCRTPGRRNKMQMGFSLSSMAYGSPKLRAFVPVLLAVASNVSFKLILPPRHSQDYNLSDGYQPTSERVREYVTSALYPLSETPAGQLHQYHRETESDYANRCLRNYESTSASMVDRLVQAFMAQWPRLELASSQLPPECTSWFNLTAAISGVRGYFTSCNLNDALRKHIRQVETALRAAPFTPEIDISSLPTSFVPVSSNPFSEATATTSGFVDIWSVLKASTEFTAPPLPLFVRFDTGARQPHPLSGMSGLKALICELKAGKEFLLPQFGEDLDESRCDLEARGPSLLSGDLPPLAPLDMCRTLCHTHMSAIFEHIKNILLPRSCISNEVLKISGLWPRITPRSLLELMSLTNRTRLSQSWLAALVTYAQSFLEYQYAQRVYDFALNKKMDDFFKEIANRPEELDSEHSKNPDWLLIQVSLCTKYSYCFDLTMSVDRRQLPCKVNSGSSRASYDGASLADQYGHATEHGRREIFRDCANDRSFPCRGWAACSCGGSQGTFHPDVPTPC